MTVTKSSGCVFKDIEQCPINELRATCDELACAILVSGNVTREQRKSLDKYEAMSLNKSKVESGMNAADYHDKSKPDCARADNDCPVYPRCSDDCVERKDGK